MKLTEIKIPDFARLQYQKLISDFFSIKQSNQELGERNIKTVPKSYIYNRN